MRIEHILDNNTKAKLGDLKQGKGKVYPKKKKPNKRKQKPLSEWELKELMGTNRDKYFRRNGAWRSK